jgi:hypothetical protein
MIEQPLHPVRGVFTGVLGQLPTVLAFHPCQQTAQERSCPPADLDPAKPRPDPLAQRLQLDRPALDLGQARIHAPPRSLLQQEASRLPPKVRL